MLIRRIRDTEGGQVPFDCLGWLLRRDADFAAVSN